MSQTTSNLGNSTANQKEYHSPKLRKFGNVSDLTLTSPASAIVPQDGGTFPNAYTS